MYTPIPRSGPGAQLRRTISPGLFEFLDGRPTGEHTAFINALQPTAACEKLLSVNEKIEHYAIPGKGAKVVSNSLPAVGVGEDRMRQDKVRIRDMAEVQSEGTWWSK